MSTIFLNYRFIKNARTFLVTLSIFGLSIGAAFAQHPALGGGTGTDSDPYLIHTGAQLKALTDYVNAGNGDSTRDICYRVMNDLDLGSYAAGEGWLPIGYFSSFNGGTEFQGVFDGNNHKITGLKINRPDRGDVALFGAISGAIIKNLGIEDCDITGSGWVGGLVGENDESTILNCYVTGTITGGGFVGGLVGSSSNQSTISNCYVAGTITGGSTYVGGLVGYNSQTTISNCYAAGSVTGERIVGGLVGTNGSNSSIQNCIAANNSVKAAELSNRIAGMNSGVLPNNYALSTMVVENMTPAPDKDGEAGANASLAQLQSHAFYTASSNWNTSDGKDWDITDPSGIWMICEGKALPFLRWQGISCEEVGISEITAEKITVYPNPTKDVLNFSLEASYELIDLQGRVLKSGKSVKTTNISGLPSGVYLIRLTTETGVSVQKVIKE